MKLDIRGHHITLSPELHEHVSRRLHLALGRFGGRVTRVTARIADVPGAGSAGDTRCKLAVALDSGESLRIEDTDVDTYVAVDRAIDRAGRAVGRRL